MITKVLVDDVYQLVYDVVEFADNVNDLVDDVTNLVHDVNDERRDVLAVTNSERKLRRILSVNPSLKRNSLFRTSNCHLSGYQTCTASTLHEKISGSNVTAQQTNRVSLYDVRLIERRLNSNKAGLWKINLN